MLAGVMSLGMLGCAWPEGYALESLRVEAEADGISPTYTLNVWVPDAFESGSPVLFLLDGDVGLGTREALRVVARGVEDGAVPPGLLVVGIGYGDEDNGRTRDYTPTPIDDVDSGEAGAFFRFVAEAAVPTIEETYGTGPDRALAGHSLGGLGATWALLHHHDTFGRIIAMSPSLMWGEQAIFGEEQAHAAANDDLPVRLHLCVGGEENRGQTVGWEALRDTLEGRGHPSLDLASAVIDGESHIGSRPDCLARGLEHAWR